MIYINNKYIVLSFLFVLLPSCASSSAHNSLFQDEKTGLVIQDNSYALWNREKQRQGVLRLHRRQAETGGEPWFYFAFINTEWVGHFDTLVVIVDGVEHVLVDPNPVHQVQTQEVVVPTGSAGRAVSLGVSSGGNVRVGASTTVQRSNVRTTTTIVTTYREELKLPVSVKLLHSIVTSEQTEWMLRSSTKQTEMPVAPLTNRQGKQMRENITVLLTASQSSSTGGHSKK